MALIDEVTVRQATLDDREAMHRIHVDAVHGLCAGHYSATQIRRWFEGRSSDDYTAAIRCGGDWIACVRGEPVAFVEFFTRSVSSLFVRSRFAGRGIGRMLMEHALATMPGEEGRVSIEATLNAVLFYERFGFRQVGAGQLSRASDLVIETVLMERLEGQVAMSALG